MSRNTQSRETGQEPPQRAARPFDAIVIALSSALLVMFGIVIGRLVVTTQAVAVVDHFDGEVASLQAEVVELSRQLAQSKTRCTALEESAEQYRRLAQQQQIRAEQLAARQQTVRSTLARLSERRDRCLGEVQQYVALDQPIPALDVLRFVDAMFDLQHHTMDQLAASTATSPPLPTVPGFPPVAAATPATESVNTLAPPPTRAAPSFAPLPAPEKTVTTARTADLAVGRAYFAPPRRQQRSASSTFAAASRESESLSMPEKSGITFHDTVSSGDSTLRR